MMKCSLQLLLLIIFLNAGEIRAQYRIQLLNGKVVNASLVQENNLYITYKKTESNQNNLRSIERIDVFSITDSSGHEEVIYRPTDSLDLTVEEARFFINGENAARQFYKPVLPPVSAALAGAGSSFLGFYGLPFPMLYAIVFTRTKAPAIRLPENYDKKMFDNESFRMGYEKTARNLKIQRCLTFGYIGFGVGLAGFMLIR